MRRSDPGQPGDAPLEAGTVVDAYRLDRLIASGGFGRVYAGWDERAGRQVAVKVLRQRHSQRADVLARFLGEARAAASLEHPNIVRVLGVGSLEDGRPYYAMELLQGEPLDALLARVGLLAPGRALAIMGPIASALDTAHSAGIIHRDLKPANIFIEENQGSIRPKLLDFGVAKLAPSLAMQNTIRGLQLGTPQYMAPEQCRGEEVDARTDVYAFGVVTFELLTGSLPFDSTSALEIYTAHVTRPPPRPSAMAGGIPREADAVILRMLEKSREQRPASLALAVAELADAFSKLGPAPSVAPAPVRRVSHEAVTLADDSDDTS